MIELVNGQAREKMRHQMGSHRDIAYRQPVNDVRVSGVTSASSVLLVTSTVDNDRVFEGSYLILVFSAA